jgi:CheY-like chemotaxis protein
LYGIVKQAGGYMSVSSEPGRGATFSLHLPSADAGSEPVGETPLQLEPGLVPPGTETILLVEDNDILRGVFCEGLRSVGYTVLDACDADTATALALEHEDRIELLVTDLMMPGVRGTALARRLRDRMPGLKVLYISAQAGDDLAEDLGSAFLAKPFTLAALGERIRSLLKAS